VIRVLVVDLLAMSACRMELPCYLETPFPETRAFYGSLGYRVIREMRAFGDRPTALDNAAPAKRIMKM
jgi:hypothetical protein